MCFFITAWIHGNVDKSLLENTLKNRGFGFHEYPDSPIKKKVGAEVYFRASASSCDCTTQFGSATRKPGKAGNADRQVEALRKKGWKESKIRRWLNEQEHTRAKGMREQKVKNGKGDVSPSNEMWLSLINDLLGANISKSIGLLCHAYRGDQTREDFEIKPMIVLKADALTPNDLSGLDSETPYEFRMKK